MSDASLGYRERNIIVIIPKKEYRFSGIEQNKQTIDIISDNSSTIITQRQAIPKHIENRAKHEILRNIIITISLTHSGRGLDRESITPIAICTWFDINRNKLDFIRTNMSDYKEIISFDIIKIINDLARESKIQHTCHTCGSYKIAANSEKINDREIIQEAIVTSSRVRSIIEDMRSRNDEWKTNFLAILADKSIDEVVSFMNNSYRFRNKPIDKEYVKREVYDIFTKASLQSAQLIQTLDMT